MLVAAELGFARTRAIIDPGPEQPVLVGQPQTAVLYSRGADRNAGNEFCPIIEVDNAFGGRELATDAGALNENLDPELHSLLACPLRKFCATDPFGETEIVFDSRAGTGLSAHGEAFDKDMTEATFAKNPKSLAAIKLYLGFAGKNGIAAPAPTTTNYLEQTNLFAQGKIASMRNAYWSVAKVLGDNPALKGKMFATPIPANVPNAPTLSSVAASSISSSCKYPDAAWKFIKFDAGKKWAVERAVVANWMPLRDDVADDPAIKADPMLAEFVRMGRTARSYPLPHPAWAGIAANDIVDAVQKALLSPEKTDEIFRDLDVRVTKKLRDL